MNESFELKTLHFYFMIRNKKPYKLISVPEEHKVILFYTKFVSHEMC